MSAISVLLYSAVHVFLLGSIAAVRGPRRPRRDGPPEPNYNYTFRPQAEPNQVFRFRSNSNHTLRPRADANYTFRVRVQMIGFVTTDSFDTVDAGFDYVDHVITQSADGFVGGVLYYISEFDVVKNLLRDMVREQSDLVKAELNSYKGMAKETVAALMDDREMLGWYYHFFTPYLGDKNDLVETLLPNASMVINSENGSVVPVIEIPLAKTEAVSRVCTMPSEPIYLFYKLIPWIVIAGLLTFYEYPRAAFGFLVAGIVLNTVFAGVVCNTVAPLYIGDYDFDKTVEVPDEMRNLGFHDNITLDYRFVGNTLRVEFEPISKELLADVLKRVAIQVGDKPGDLPIKVLDGHVLLLAENQRIAIGEGTWFDVDIEIEDCAPLCEGGCYIFKC